MSGSPFVVVGDTLLDRDLDGSVHRLCPHAAVPVVDVHSQCWRPGGAGLAALLAAAGGHRVVLITALGTDPAGQLLSDLLDGYVEVVAMPISGTTACKTRIRAGNQSLLRVDTGDGQPTGAPTDTRFPHVLRGANGVLVSDYGRGVTAHPAIREELSVLTHQVPIVWDPHPRGSLPVAGCRLVTPNEAEAAQSLPAPAEEAVAAAILRAGWRCDAVAITLGSRGAVLATAQGCTSVPVPGPNRSRLEQDSCGAGDAFAATALGALLAGHSPHTAVCIAVRAASQFVAQGAAASVPPRFVETRHSPRERVPAREMVARLRQRGGRLVATGGCFDVLHPGHVNLLRQARALGDVLVVCVNSDESVRRRKGPGRPVVPAAGRIAVLEALEPVDAVIMFDADTPAELLETLRPDVWVKGGDYTIEQLPEAPVVRRYGGQVVIIPLVGGYSTSRLLASARDAPQPPAAHHRKENA
jgi:rfaE bifunctional protein nucleotidyltransferase chain/domain/rfaE bifunctional protein kinase chain/domain